MPLLENAHSEMGKLSAKKQDGLLNELKVRNINRLLAELRKVLADDPSVHFLETLDEETLPDNSDATLLLSQWIGALEQFKTKHYGHDRERGHRRWFTREDPGQPVRPMR